MALFVPRIPPRERASDPDESDGSALALFVILVGEVIVVGLALWWLTGP